MPSGADLVIGGLEHRLVLGFKIIVHLALTDFEACHKKQWWLPD